MDSKAKFRNAAVAVFLFALAIRGAALWAAGDSELVKDEIAYVARASALLDGQGYLGSYQSWVRHEGWKIMDLPQYPGAYQPPAYPTFIAAILAVSGRSLLAVKLVQCVLSAGSCVFLLALGRRWFGERTGTYAAWGCALYPNLVAFSHLLWSETLFIFELLAFLWLLFGVPDRGLPSPRRAAEAGLVLGAAALTRGTILYLTPVLLVWLWLLGLGASELASQANASWKLPLARGLVVLGVAAAVIAPWSIRNYGIHDGFVLIDTNAPYNLWRGNVEGALEGRRHPDSPHYSWPFESIPLHPVAGHSGRVLIESFRHDEPYADPTDLAIAEYASRTAWRAIFADPARALRNAGTKLVDMWNPTSFVLRHFEEGAYGEVSGSVRGWVSALAVITYLVTCLLAAVGFVKARGDRRVWLIAATVIYFSAISALAFGLTRFRLPLIPLLILVAAVPFGGALDEGQRPGEPASS